MISYGQVSRRRHDLNIHQLLTNSLSKMKKCSYVKTRVTLFIKNETQHDSSWPAVYSILMSDEVNSNMTSLLTSQWYQNAQKTFFESQTLYKSTDHFHAVNVKSMALLMRRSFRSFNIPPWATHGHVAVVYVRGWGIGTLPGWVGNFNQKS